ncbi:hypothetical protein F750_0960 [Streptomyces sp. PAMC 26508]|jgi:hypothetical protein|nr:hypothetical protein F750_0960 [Streptomyces sp. PAMC 26508]
MREPEHPVKITDDTLPTQLGRITQTMAARPEHPAESRWGREEP